MIKQINEYIEHERRKNKPRTLLPKMLFVRIFHAFIMEIYPDVKEITDVTREMIKSYEKYLTTFKDGRKKILSYEQRRRYLLGLKWFFEYLEREEKIYKNVASNLAIPRAKQRIVKDILSIEDMEKLLKSVGGSRAIDMRDRAILELMYSTALRSDEVCGLLIKDIDFDQGEVFVRRPKLGKERITPIGETALMWVRRYMEKARMLMLDDSGNEQLFVNMKGEPLRNGALSLVIKRRIKLSGIGKNATCHTFRHSCASHMLKGGADIRYVQQHLGHKAICTTEKYLKVEIGDLKEVHARTHPRERGEV